MGPLPPTGTGTGRRSLITWLRIAAGVAVMAVAFIWILPSFADYGDVWPYLTALRPDAAAGLIIVGAANLVAPSISQIAALPGLRLRQAVVADWATTLVTNVVPGGSALAIGLIWSMYRRWGLARDAIARSIVVTGVWDTLTKLASPLLAILWLATQRPVDGFMVRAAVVGGILFVVAAALAVAVLVSARFGRTIGLLLDRLPLLGAGWPAQFEELRRQTLLLLSQRGIGLTLWTIAGHANLYLVLLLCVRAVGVDAAVLSAAAVLAAFTFGRLVTALPLTPGGVGVMEVGLVGALAAFATAPAAIEVRAPIVAGVLLFRLLSYALPLPLGALSLAWWTAAAQASPASDENLSNIDGQ